MLSFELSKKFHPKGDQPQAIEALVSGIQAGKKHQILLGVTGSGKTFTVANVIEKLQLPTLVIAHNKTLAAQLYQEFKFFFPKNAVEYFVSYYDYYQPEAYIPSRDVYIEKEANINQEIERLRHRATKSLLTRKDVIIVASVSCIYGLGIPEAYIKGVISLQAGTVYPRKTLLSNLNNIQYQRQDIEFSQGHYRVKGDVIDIKPSWEENVLRLSFFGDELERIQWLHPVTFEQLDECVQVDIFPATHYVMLGNQDTAIASIQSELKERYQELIGLNKEFEARRLESKTNYDIDMMREMGYCKGIENYSRHLSGRMPGQPGGVLIDFFPDNFLTIIDESHVTLPQIEGMYGGDQSRKNTLIDYGFRLPSARDNRPLKADEFEEKIKHRIYVSATPGVRELNRCFDTTLPLVQESPFSQYHVVEQLIRPTGLVDPEIFIYKTQGQIPHLFSEIKKRIEVSERTLITALTKQNAEEISDYFFKKGVKVQYLHSDIHSLDRVDILHDLRLGKYDVLVGVNLLREGLDLPEVSLVAILDADKEGFLRNERSLIQLMGRAARHINGQVILYADKMTESIQYAVQESKRRREIQLAYNQAHGIIPKSATRDMIDMRPEERKPSVVLPKIDLKTDISAEQLAELEKQMQDAASRLDFELAAAIRDEIKKFKEDENDSLN